MSAEIAALDRASFTVSAAEQQVQATATATGDYGKFKPSKLGLIEISVPGKLTLAVRPVKDGWHPINLKAIRLKPVTAAP